MDNSNLALADYLVVTGFFVVMIFVGIYFAGRMRSLQDYFSGGKQVPWFLSGISLYMSSFSAFSFVAYSALAYRYGWVAITVWWMCIPSVVLATLGLAARWRRAVTTSALEYIETRFGRALRQGLAWLGSPMTILDDGLKLFAIGKLVSVSLGISVEWGIFLSGTIMLFYTFLGGLWAVVVTDFVQFVVMFLAVIVLIPLSLQEVGGFGQFLDKVPADFFRLATSGEEGYGWVFLFVGIMLIQFLKFSTTWAFIQRYYSVATDSDARKTGFTVAFLYFVGPPLLYLPAMAARVFLPEGTEPNDVYALLCIHLLPVGMIGMVLAAMFSATMSMLSSDYNAVAAVLTNDVYKRLFARSASDHHLVWAGRIITLGIGFFALGFGFLVANMGEVDLVKIMVKVFATCLPPIALPMILGLLSRRTSYAGGLFGFLLGATGGIGAFFLNHFDVLIINSIAMTLITTLMTITGIAVGSALKQDSVEKGKQVAQFLKGLEGGSDDGKEDRPSNLPQRVFPGIVIGVSTVFLGALLVLTILFTVPLEQWIVSMPVGICMLAIGAVFLWIGLSQQKRSIA